jgi:anti-sigma factor RsiW
VSLRRAIFGMSCREVADFLCAHLDGELSRAERRAFERHLFWCRPCVTYLESYRTTVRLARSLGSAPLHEVSEPMPEALVLAVLAARAAGRAESGD